MIEKFALWLTAARALAGLGRARRIVASPYWRTLQTAEIIVKFEDVVLQMFKGGGLVR